MPDNNFKVVQFRRGNTAQNAAFVGYPGELTIDTQKNCVVVQDGTTPGGFPLKVESVEYAQPRYVTFRAAVVQQGIPSLGFSSAQNAPTALPYWTSFSTDVVPSGAEPSIITGVARFDVGHEQAVQDHFLLPDNWASDSFFAEYQPDYAGETLIAPIVADILWRTEGTMGTVGWSIETCSVPIGGIIENAVFGPPQMTTLSLPVGTEGPLALMTNTVAVDSTGFSPGDEVFFRLTRTNTFNDVGYPADLVSLRFAVFVHGK